MVAYWHNMGEVPGSNPGKGENFSVKISHWIIQIWIGIYNSNIFLRSSWCNLLMPLFFNQSLINFYEFFPFLVQIWSTLSSLLKLFSTKSFLFIETNIRRDSGNDFWITKTTPFPASSHFISMYIGASFDEKIKSGCWKSIFLFSKNRSTLV